MTDLLSRPILRVQQPEAAPTRPVVLTAAVSAGAVAAGGLLLCLAGAAAGWFAADSGSFGQAVSVGTLAWLVGNGSGLTGPGVSVTLIPLGFALLCGLGLHRAGRWAAATSRSGSWLEVATAGAAMAAVYAGCGSVAAVTVSIDGTHAPVLRTLLAFTAVAALFGGTGLLRGAGRALPLAERLPDEVRAILTGGAFGTLTLVALSAVVFVGALVVHLPTALRLAEGLHAGFVGGLILALVGAAVVPNAVLCAGAFVVGPGFALGAGTQVSPSGVHLGLLPDLPILAAVPTSASAWWLPGLVVLPVLAGAGAGLVASRRCPPFGLDRAALRGALAGLTCGVAFGLLTMLGTGGVGPGRMSHLGPDVLATTAVCVVACTLGGALASTTFRFLGGRDRRRRDAAADAEATQPIPVVSDAT